MFNCLFSGIYSNFCSFLCKKCDIGYYVISCDNDWWLLASVYSFNFIITQNSWCLPKLNTRNCSLCFPLRYVKKIHKFLPSIRKDAHKRKLVPFFCLTLSRKDNAVVRWENLWCDGPQRKMAVHCFCFFFVFRSRLCCNDVPRFAGFLLIIIFYLLQKRSFGNNWSEYLHAVYIPVTQWTVSRHWKHF